MPIEPVPATAIFILISYLTFLLKGRDPLIIDPLSFMRDQRAPRSYGWGIQAVRRLFFLITAPAARKGGGRYYIFLFPIL
jgi:hypothetical protein